MAGKFRRCFFTDLAALYPRFDLVGRVLGRGGLVSPSHPERHTKGEQGACSGVWRSKA